MSNFVRTLYNWGKGWSERLDSNQRPLTPQITKQLENRDFARVCDAFCSRLFSLGSRQLWPTLDCHQPKGTTMNFKTIAVALSLALAFQPVTSFAAGTSSTALSAAAKNRLAQKLKSLAARNLPTTGVDPGTGSAAATYSAPADTGVQSGSVVIEGGTVISGPLY